MNRVNILEYKNHSKATERYVVAQFYFDEQGWFEWTVPVVYPMLGLDLKSEPDIIAYLNRIREYLNESSFDNWRAEQEPFWEGKRDGVTKAVFDFMARDFGWYAYKEMPAPNNAASRVKALKQFGYTFATRKRPGHDYEFRLVPLPRGDETGYEWWSGKLRTRIIKTLGSFDAYEAKTDTYDHLLPDHKFPEARWDTNTRRETLENLTEDDIRRDFQLLTNQRNQQKREVCRNCVQTRRRGVPFGIPFFHQGGPEWPADIPERGKAAEAGCVGCGWYDLQEWRQALLATLAAR